MSKIIVKGLASGKTVSQLNSPKLSISLLDFLRQNNIPIASSCQGEGICKKCVFNKDKLACKLILPLDNEDLTIEIDYL
jgi:ferredoxin